MIWKDDGQHMQFLDIHFLNVGHGDCTFVEFPERLTMIDINNCRAFGKDSEAELRRRYAPSTPWRTAAATAGLGGQTFGSFLSESTSRLLEENKKLQEAKDRLTDPVDYYKANFAGRSIFRYIQSHPDMDHMAGLYRMWVQEKVQIENFWDTKHCIEKDEDAMRTGEVNHDVRDWYTYLKLRKSTQSPTVLHLTNGAKNKFWMDDGIYIWAPLNHAQEQNAECDPNDLSYLFHIQFGECSIVMGGDATEETWSALYKANKARGLTYPKVNLLKASHHGRKTGYHMESVKEMNPDLTIMSVGELKAKDDATASYERYSNKGCYSTLDHGNILATCFIDGEIRLFDGSRNKIASSWS